VCATGVIDIKNVVCTNALVRLLLLMRHTTILVIILSSLVTVVGGNFDVWHDVIATRRVTALYILFYSYVPYYVYNCMAVDVTTVILMCAVYVWQLLHLHQRCLV